MINPHQDGSGTIQRDGVGDWRYYIVERNPLTHLSVVQLTLLILWIAVLFVDLVCTCFRPDTVEANDVELESGAAAEKKAATSKTEPSAPATVAKLKPRPPLVKVVRGLSILGLIMLIFWLCDEKQVFSPQRKFYDRDIFLFLLLGILITASRTVTVTKPMLLGRGQTEEWKGWMQIVFLLYHYFAAKEFYNLIRVLIAGYVWMTGYGNYRYFQQTGDYSFWRLAKMLFRLNFLVLVIIGTMNTNWTLYYICPMHTLWFLSVYLLMSIKSSWNSSAQLFSIKLAVYFCLVCLIWEIPGACETVFTPFYPLVQFQGSLHEWVFRTTLDHWSTFVGILCGIAYPHLSKKLSEFESAKTDISSTTFWLKIFSAGLVLWTLQFWGAHVYLREKFAYNAIHPYWSFVPLLSYIYLRNLFPVMRKYHLSLLESAGKITLETYLCQFHIWMCRNDGRYVGAILTLIPDYPMLNFALNTAIYIYISQVLFNLTTLFSSYLLPKSTRQSLKVTLGAFFSVAITVYLLRALF